MSDSLEYISRWRESRRKTGWWHSFELPNGDVIHGVSSLEAQKMRLAQFDIPADLTGKRVLDVGTWDGWFAMEMERRGAEVVAIDRWENPRFQAIREILGSRTEYLQLSVYDLSPDQIGYFDIVLLMGVLYHLKHPLLALERVAAVASNLVAIESFVVRERHRPGTGIEGTTVMEFYERDELGGQFDNWIGPTVPCLLALCRAAGFARVELKQVQDFGAAVNCYRKWSARAASIPKPINSFTISRVFNAETYGINFNSRSSDDYVGCRVTTEGFRLERELLWPEVSGYGSRPVSLLHIDGEYEAIFKLPPGLSPGWHLVRLIAPEATSDTRAIAVDIKPVADSLVIKGIRDGVSWESFRACRFVSLWVAGLPMNSDITNVNVYVAKRKQLTTFVGASTADNITQINVELYPNIPKGTQPLTVEFGGLEVHESVEIAYEASGLSQ